MPGMGLELVTQVSRQWAPMGQAAPFDDQRGQHSGASWWAKQGLWWCPLLEKRGSTAAWLTINSRSRAPWNGRGLVPAPLVVNGGDR